MPIPCLLEWTREAPRAQVFAQMNVLSSGNRAVKARDAEPIPGYRLLEPLGKGGFGEVWKCEAPGGICKAIKFVSSGDDSALGNEPNGADQELRALQHIKTIRHPFLLSMDRVEQIGRELVIVMELADKSLHDVLLECKAANKPGLDRSDLLLYLRETAEVLDLMNQEYGLQHLDIKPRNLFLVRQHVKVADFGLVNSLAELNEKSGDQFQLAAVTPLYASPETFAGRISLFSDQYSLAIVYCELLTGKLPFSGKNFRQLAMQHTASPPDLSGLSDEDRMVVAKALAKDSRERFPSCMAFIRALIAGANAVTPPAAETKCEENVGSAGTMHDLQLVEKKKTAAIVIARPTRVQRVVRPEVAATGQLDEAEKVDEFHYLDCLGRTPLGELWRVETPEGMPRLLKLVNTFSSALGEENTAAQLGAIRHRGLFPARFIAHTANRLAIVTAPIKETVASRLLEAREHGQRGIPRLELLGYLLTAARTLDELKKLYGLQHLGLNSRNLLLMEGELKIADFGLVPLVWIPGGQHPSQINPRYSAPELFQQRVSRTCDQYSLALLFCELLTGDPLHGSRTANQLAALRSKLQDDLDQIPALDRPAMSRALHPEPDQRFPSCVDFVRALIDHTPGGEDLLTQDGWSGVEREMSVRAAPEKTPPIIRVDRVTVERMIGGIVRDLTGQRELREYHTAPYFYRPGKEIEHRCYARLVPGTLRLKLTGFIEQWKASLIEQLADQFRFRMRLTSSLWRRVLGAQPALDIDVRALSPATSGATLTEVCLLLRPFACSADEGTEALERWGPQLIDSLRTHLQVGPERRKNLRLPYERTLTARAMQGHVPVGETVACKTKDISLAGMGIYLPIKPPSQLLLQLSRSQGEEPVEFPAKVVRSCSNGDGAFEVGVQFLLDS